MITICPTGRLASVNTLVCEPNQGSKDVIKNRYFWNVQKDIVSKCIGSSTCEGYYLYSCIFNIFVFGKSKDQGKQPAPLQVDPVRLPTTCIEYSFYSGVPDQYR